MEGKKGLIAPSKGEKDFGSKAHKRKTPAPRSKVSGYMLELVDGDTAPLSKEIVEGRRKNRIRPLSEGSRTIVCG